MYKHTSFELLKYLIKKKTNSKIFFCLFILVTHEIITFCFNLYLCFRYLFFFKDKLISLTPPPITF